jgi:hypothetical protein
VFVGRTRARFHVAIFTGTCAPARIPFLPRSARYRSQDAQWALSGLVASALHRQPTGCRGPAVDTMVSVTDPDPRAAFAAMTKALITDFRANGGRVTSGPFAGRPVLLLTTTGAKSGQPRLAPVVY